MVEMKLVVDVVVRNVSCVAVGSTHDAALAAEQSALDAGQVRKPVGVSGGVEKCSNSGILGQPLHQDFRTSRLSSSTTFCNPLI